jgi:hypothetical protein
MQLLFIFDCMFRFKNYIKPKHTYSMTPRSERFEVRSRKLSNIGQSLNEYPKVNYLELLRASERTLSCWSRLYFQSIAPSNPHWARVVARSPYVQSMRKAYAPAVGELIG